MSDEFPKRALYDIIENYHLNLFSCASAMRYARIVYCFFVIFGYLKVVGVCHGLTHVTIAPMSSMDRNTLAEVSS